ncbi:MAG TPA: sigma-70 family RNA polymerase sigma factor [Myxococcales bacterium]|nr:sigma-70 family RNA polymerase sigma factor [Myxococcales bacterium]
MTQAASPPEVPATTARALRGGDPAAFEGLVREHQDRVFDFCVRMLGDREEALEVVQEIFVSVHQALPTFRFDSKVSTWIYRISKNHCLNRLKYLARRGRGRSDELDGVSEEALAEAAGAPPRPDEALQAEAERALVQKAIARLEPDQRMLVALRDIEGLSYEEMVDVTGLPLGTVKSRLHRAREKLAEYLVQEVPGAESI